MTSTPRPAVLTVPHPIEFFQTEKGAPWAVFCWGYAPASAFTIDRLVEAVVYHSNRPRAEAQELIGLGIDPQPLWLRLEDDTYFFCDKNHPDAQRVTGARF